MRLDLNAFVVFATVVDAGGFTAAARRLGVSKSAVSKQVSALEDRLRTRLLNRTTRKLSVTEAGLAVFERASRIIAEAEEAEAVVGDLAAEPRGRLRVNAPHSFGIRRLGEVIAAFSARYPDVEMDIVLNDRQVDLVDEGFDVAVRIAQLKDSSLIARRLMGVERFLCAAPSYLERVGAPASPRDVASHRFFAYTLQERPYELRFANADGTTTTVRISPVVTANSGDLLLSLLERGQGLGAFPDFIVEDAIAEGRIVRLFEDHPLEPLAVHAVYPAVRHLASKVRVFVDFLAEWFSDRNPGGETTAARATLGGAG